MSPSQLVAAALRELQADPPDLAEARSILGDIPIDLVPAVAAALVEMAGMLQYRTLSQLLRAGAK